ncbi:lysylphosphatidylglycerol synthase transmembrane domain-containing protein [Algisphaera agarilytica]|uniref:Lysylphosphatidylglycerol synthase TM region n=1 Tax=Algisphaera agarilytica TaxID=1385975 RepID=A0A7X0H5B5_9BACT|nr:lysylphosphatidylglycerol synthase transmembrane domain-containing protein [Algisphaera agarilytica]MBB6429403.1 hypothetical protein [Algisphaera agarilytica]
MKHKLRKHLFTAVRVLLIAAGIGYIAWTVQWGDATTLGPDGEETQQPGMLTLVKGADPVWLLGGLALTSLVLPLQAVRWWLLMRCRGMNVSLRSVFKLVMVGLFFNFCVPVGTNGGDVVKAYGAARGIKTPGSTTKAIISVLMDRVAGLLGLIVLAALAGPMVWDDPVGRQITIFAWAALGFVVLSGGLYLWPVTRKWLGVTTLRRVGVFEKIDEAVVGYRHHPSAVFGSIGLSVPVHISICIATAMAGYAIGVPTPLLTLLAVLPIVFIVGALPLTFMGLGLMEPTMFGLLKSDGGITFNQVTAMIMAFRAYFLAYALIGGLFVLTKGVSLSEKPAADTADASA